MSQVTFHVKTPPSYGCFQVFIVGNCNELGNWTPNLATPLSLRSSSEASDYWSGSVCLQSAAKIEYRFFMGNVLRASGDGQLITTISWESFSSPRSLIVPVNGDIDCDEATYGCGSDGQWRVDSGWLTGQSEIHMRLGDLHFQDRETADVVVDCIPLNSYHIGRADSYLSVPFCSPVFYTSRSFSGTQNLPKNGIVFHGNNDFLVLKVQTCFVDQVSYRIVVSYRKDHCLVEIGSIFLKLNSNSKAESLHLPIVDRQQEIIGSLDVDILVINPLREGRLDGCFMPRHLKHRSSALVIGHRGMGSSYILGKKSSTFPENTIRSLNEAGKNGADMVEFDVLLTRDEIPVVFHDFIGCVNASDSDQERGYPLKVSVTDLTLEEIHNLHVKKCLDFSVSFPCAEDERPFPTLRSCLEKVDPNLAFDIEVKYCMLRRQTKKLEDGLEWFPERNRYIDIIIDEVLRYANNRLIVFSSFDPDVCMMLNAKQARFPVLFLSQGETTKYPAFLDPRTATLSLGVDFAAAESLAGVAVHSEGLLKDLSLIDRAKSRGLAVYCWGTDNNNMANLSLLRSLGVDGLCYDNIDEYNVTAD